MKMQMNSQLYQWQQSISQQTADPVFRSFLGIAFSFLGGFCLSAASLGNMLQPFCLGVLCAGLPGWLPMSFAVGSSLGYWAFWGQAGTQALVWLAAGLPVSIIRSGPQQKLLQPGLAAMIVAASGLIFQLWQGEDVAIAMYLLRIVLAFGTTCLGQLIQQSPSSTARWPAVGIGVLALAQIAPVPYLNLGMMALGALTVIASLPSAALAGLALDLAGIIPVPMTAVACLAYLIGRIPWLPRRGKLLIPGMTYLLVMGLCGQSSWQALPGLLLGGTVSLLIPPRQILGQATAQSDPIQLRLETLSGVMAQSKLLLQQTPVYPLDEGAVILRASERACDHCDQRRNCPVVERVKFLPQTLLHQNTIAPEHLPAECKRKERLLLQLQRGQDQYRMLLSDRQRQREYRTALLQQYGFLATFLQDLAEDLPHREAEKANQYRPEVAVCTRGKEKVNGDRCFRFAGEHNRYYILLCDGMGTGEEAAYEARTAGNLLRRMLTAGLDAHQAMQSLNSLCALRRCAGAVTIDLAEADLLSGRVTLYKWGAAPSWLLHREGAQQIGQECPPPGLALEDTQETADKVILQGNGVLLMLSDGVDGEAAAAALTDTLDQPAGFLATLVLESGAAEVSDDATAVVLRLHPI